MRKFVETSVADESNSEKTQRTVAKKQLSDGSTVAFLITASMSNRKESTAQKYYNFYRENPHEHALSSLAYIEEFHGSTIARVH